MSPQTAIRFVGAVCILLCTAQPYVLAQSPGTDFGADFDVEHLGTADGLSHRIVYDILEDHQGFMWFATRDGLNRYDGHRFKVYRHVPEDSTTLSDSKVTVLFEDRDSVLWAGTMEGGLNRFDRQTETFTRYLSVPDDSTTLSDARVTAIAEDSTGSLWVGAEKGGVNRMDGRSGSFVRHRFSDGFDPSNLDHSHPISKRVNGLLTDQNGRVWIGSSGANWEIPGLCVMDPEKDHCSFSIEPGFIVEAQAVGPDGSIWVADVRSADGPKGSRRQIRRFDPLSRIESGKADLGYAGNIKSMILDRANVLWVTTATGLVVVESSTLSVKRVVTGDLSPSRISDNSLQEVHEDRSGVIWVGSAAGIDRLQPRKAAFRHHRHLPGNSNSLSESDVNALLETRDGWLWVGTSKGLNRIAPEGKNAERLSIQVGPGTYASYTNRIWSLFEDENSDVWIGTGGAGLYRYDQSRNKFVYERGLYNSFARRYPTTPTDELDQLRITSIAAEHSGDFWFLTTSGAARLNKATDSFDWFFHLPGDSSSLSNNHVHIVYQDAHDRIWLATDKGINHFQDGQFVRYLHIPGDTTSLSANIVWTMAESPLTPGILWVGTVGGGLNRFDPDRGTFRAYTTAHGLPSNVIYGILTDEHGRLWMSTEHGLSRFDPISETFTNFDQGDGLQDNSFNLMAYHRSRRTGEMFFGGPNGFNTFFPDSIHASNYKPPVVITGVSLFDQERPGMFAADDTLRLRHDENFFTLSFASLDYANPIQNRYRYVLEGFDPGWRETTGAFPSATYTGIPPGQYRFVDYGSNSDGVFSENHAALLVDIVPAFWQTGLFRFLTITMMVFAAGGIVYAFQLQRIRLLYSRIREEAEVKRRLAESQEAERLRIARELHDGPMQALYTVRHHLEMADTSLDKGDRPNLSSPRDTVDRLTLDIRAVCNALRPPVLAHFGLKAALEHLVGRFRRMNPTMKVEIHLDDDACELDDARQHAVFRIVQEGLNNAAEHAHASHVSLQMECLEQAVEVRIKDDGQGFRLPERWVELARDEHFGLLGMMERAESVGGNCTVESAPGRGTGLHVVVPFDPDAHKVLASPSNGMQGRLAWIVPRLKLWRSR